MSQLYQTEDYFHQRFQATVRSHAFRAESLAEACLWQADLRARLIELSGLNRHVPTAPQLRVTDSVQCEGYQRDHVLLDTEPGVTMPIYVLIPDELKEDTPVIIACHGHGCDGKAAIAGVAPEGDTDARTRIEQYNYDYGLQAVKQGYIVFCPDARGFGERRESYSAKHEQRFDSSCRQLAHMGTPLGLTVIGMWTWDLMRLLDHIKSQPDTSGRRIGCIGLSGGGAQVMWLSALDERVDCAVISGYFYGVEDALLHLSNNCDCNYVPHLWETADMGDIAALIAPRPLLVESARQDDLNGPRGIENVLEQYRITRKAYAVYNAPDNLAHDIFEGGHEWHGAAVFQWLDRWLSANSATSSPNAT